MGHPHNFHYLFAAVVWNSAEDYADAVADKTVATYHAALQALAKGDLESMFVPYGPTWHYVLSQPVVEVNIVYILDDHVPEDIRDTHVSVNKLFQGCGGYCGQYAFSYPPSGENMAISLWGWDSIEVSSVFGCQVNAEWAHGLMQAHMTQGEVNDEFREAGEVGLAMLKNLKHKYAHFQTWP